MRILSQNRMLDLPYESIGVCINCRNKTEIIAFPAGVSSPDDEYWLLAEYSTEDKARCAMEMLYESYKAHFQYKVMTPEHIALLNNCTDEKEQENMYGIFQFPSDDEVEVLYYHF